MMSESSAVEPRWFDVIEPSEGDRPWQTWVKALGFPRRYGPLEAAIEHAVEDAILHVDRRRLAVAGALAALPQMWAVLCKHHIALDDCWKYRRKRYLLWRAAALKTMLHRSLYQDAADAAMIRDRLLATYREFAPLDINGNYGTSYNIWRPDPRSPVSGLECYAADVLALFSIATPRRSEAA